MNKKADMENLREKIKIVENENNLLIERTEEIELLSSISESISDLKDEEEIINDVLEKISIVKDIPFCVYGEIIDATINIKYKFLSFTESTKHFKNILVSPYIRKKITTSSYFTNEKRSKNSKLLKQLRVKKFKPNSVLTFPVSNNSIHSAIFLFADDDRDQNRLFSFLAVLQQVINMTTAKLDNLRLIGELNEFTSMLETKVTEKTRDLVMKNKDLLKEIEERKKAEKALRNIDWLLTKGVSPESGEQYEQPYGNLVELNANRLIADSVGEKVLEGIAGDYLDLLDSSGAIYEKNGAYALGIFSSGWCRFLDNASYNLCDTDDKTEALTCGKWHCHESCWNEASKPSMEKGEPVDIECSGGIRLYAVPIRAGEKIIGSINFGYGDPPKDKNKLKELAKKYNVSEKELKILSDSYESRPSYIIDIAKKRLQVSANLIGEITERKQAEDALRKERELAQQYLDIAGVIFVTINTKGEVTLINRRGTEVLGYEREEIIGKNWFENFLPDSIKEEVKITFDKLTNGKIESVEYYENIVVNKDGAERIIAWHNTILKDDDGKVFGTLSSGEDITERKQDEEAVKKSEALYHDLVETSQDLIWQCDSEGRYTYLNPAWEELFGYKIEEMLGRKFSDFQTPEYAERDIKEFQRLLIGNTVKGLETCHLGKAGNEIHLVFNAKFLRDENGNIAGTKGTAYDITESKQSEKALKQSLSLLEATLESTVDGILVVDQNGIIERYNNKFIELWKIPEAIIQTRNDDDALNYILAQLEYPDLFLKKVKELYNDKKAESFDLIEFKDGKVFERFSRPQLIDDKAIGRVWSFRDITDRKRAERTLRESEERFKFLFEYASVPVWLEDFSAIKKRFDQLKKEGIQDFEKYFEQNFGEVSHLAGLVRVIDVNQKSVEFYKAVDKASLVKELPSYFTEESLLVFQRELVALAKGEDRFESEIPIHTPSGEKLNLIVSLSVPAIYIDTLERVTVSFLDITERKLAEEALRESEKRFRSVTHSANDAIITVNSKGTIISWNKGAEQIFGYTEAEVITKELTILVPQIYREQHLQGMKRIIEGGESHVIGKTVELNGKHKSGKEIPIELSLAEWEMTSGKYFTGIIRDITERKRAESEIIKAKELAENSEKLKSEFLAQMSHEIRTPINAILSFSSLLRDEIGELVPKEMESAFDIMSNAGKRIIRTIDLILNMSEIQIGTYKPTFKKFNLFSDVLIPLSTQYTQIIKEKGLEFIIKPGDGIFNINADEYTVTQIFDNLLGNAVKYTMEGEIEITGRQDRNKIIIGIRDTGIGITEEYLPDLFKPFSQEEQGYTRKFEGAGLGLALVRKYCELNQAEIQCESKKGKGSKFRIIFSTLSKL